jgi:hypothetical protein
MTLRREWLWIGLMTIVGACRPGATPMGCAPWGTPEELAIRPSPYDSVSLPDGRAKVCYSKPSARGRAVFGQLVPFDTLWRTGANEPTIIHLSEAAEIAGLAVEPGDYSIYTVPSPGRWTVVVNASTSQWGLTQDDRGPQGNFFPNAYTQEVRAQEVGRAPINTEETAFTEQLTATFRSRGAAEHDLLIDWETTRVVIPVRFTTPAS